MEVRTVAEINSYQTVIINPMEQPDQTFELYSVPSFDNQHPEIIKGSEIGSTKVAVEEGDVLICKINPRINRVWVVKHFTEYPLLASSEWIVVRNREIESSYLKWYFSSPTFRNLITSQVAGIGGSLTRAQPKQVAKYPVPIPEKSEQKRIVFILDKVSNLISLRKQQLAKLDELVKARFVELFGDPVVNPKSWETAPLSALIINANNGMARRGKDADGSIVLRLVELQNGFIDYSAPNRICLNDTEKKRYELVDNDFLFARVNGNPDYVGRCAVFKSIGEPVFHNDHIIRVHFDETKINGCFTSVLLNSDYGKRQMREQIKTSAGQYTISQDGIGAIMAILPPLELQEQFAAFVEQTDKSKVAVQKALDEAQLLFDSLMQKYFG